MNRPSGPGYYWFRGTFQEPNQTAPFREWWEPYYNVPGEKKSLSGPVLLEETGVGRDLRVELPGDDRAHRIARFEGEWLELTEEKLFGAGRKMPIEFVISNDDLAEMAKGNIPSYSLPTNCDVQRIVGPIAIIQKLAKELLTHRPKVRPERATEAPMKHTHTCDLCVADEIADRLRKKRYFHCEWLQRRARYSPWRIIKMRRIVPDEMVILCRHRDGSRDYVVFIQGLRPRAIPSDTFFGSRKAADEYFQETIKDEELSE